MASKCNRLPVTATKAEMVAAHKANMARKAVARAKLYAAFRLRRDAGFEGASINRHTGKPHEHKREIARRLRRA